MKINTKLNIILILIILEFIFLYWLYLQANSLLIIAEIKLNHAENIVRALYG